MFSISMGSIFAGNPVSEGFAAGVTFFARLCYNSNKRVCRASMRKAMRRCFCFGMKRH